MIANLSHAVDRTRAVFDQLGMLWAPEGHVSLSVHGLTHEQLHALGGAEDLFRDPVYPSVERYVVVVRLRTPAGWEVSCLGDAQPSSCERCRELVTIEARATETLQVAGIVDRMDGGGL